MDSDHILEYESLYEACERNLKIEECSVALPRLLELSKDDPLHRTRAYLLCARSSFVARDAAQSELMLNLAANAARFGPIEAQVQVAATRASLRTSASKIDESNDALAFAIEHLQHVSKQLQAYVLSIRGRNEAIVGNYVDAIEHSQEAIAHSPTHSLISSFANGTMAYVFASMYRYEEAEAFMLNQVEILNERGSNYAIAGSYAFLCEGACAQQNWKKALEYQKKAMEFIGSIPSTSAIRPNLLFWMADSQLGMGDSEAASEYALEGLRLVEEMSNDILILNAQILLGKIRYAQQQFDEALKLLRMVLDRESALGDSQRIILFRTLAETYYALDRRADAFDVCWRLWKLQVDYDLRTREALLNYHRSLEQKVHAQKTAILQLKATQVERELAVTASQLAAQTDLLGRFRNDLREIVRETRASDEALNKIKEKLKALPCEQIDWGKFEAQFASVHPDFKAALEEKHPDLTRSEVKICSLSRLKLTSEEIAKLICLSPRSVETHRFNIRKKLKLSKEENLAQYLATL